MKKDSIQNRYNIQNSILYGYFSRHDGKDETTVTFPSDITGIGPGAFSGHDTLATVDIPRGVKSIDSQAFGYCQSLRSVSIPDSVTKIADRVFWNCPELEVVNIPCSVKSIEVMTFLNTGIRTLEIPEGVKTIESRAFAGCKSLKSVYIPVSVDEIKAEVFIACDALDEISIPETYVGEIERLDVRDTVKITRREVVFPCFDVIKLARLTKFDKVVNKAFLFHFLLCLKRAMPALYCNGRLLAVLGLADYKTRAFKQVCNAYQPYASQFVQPYEAAMLALPAIEAHQPGRVGSNVALKLDC